MAKLVARTRKALKAFGNAKAKGNYNKLLKYLCPNHVIVHRVNDITPIHGSAEYIVDQFNANQVGQWPRIEDLDKSIIAKSPLNDNEVIVIGRYCDTETAHGIPVICRYHFDKDKKIDVVLATRLKG